MREITSILVKQMFTLKIAEKLSLWKNRALLKPFQICFKTLVNKLLKYEPFVHSFFKRPTYKWQ